MTKLGSWSMLSAGAVAGEDEGRKTVQSVDDPRSFSATMESSDDYMSRRVPRSSSVLQGDEVLHRNEPRCSIEPGRLPSLLRLDPRWAAT